MSLVRKNIIANLIGSGWVALISIAFIPLYIHFMGVESYGLIGFYLTLQALFAVLDMGLTATISRELARLSALQGKAQEMRSLVRTLEIVYWCVAIVVMVVVTLLAPWIATQWLNASALSEETVHISIILMGMMIGLRMPYGFYSGGLLGLQQQVLLNVIKVVAETLRSGGVVLILWWVSPEITAFFLWQLIISALGAAMMAMALWSSLPASAAKTVYQGAIIRRLWRFAAGMSVISLLSAILIQMDKVILSKMLSLEAFAYYAFASTVAVCLAVIIGPLFSAVYPRFTQLLANNEESVLKGLYHKSCQLMTVLVMPLALVISCFSSELLRLWTQDEVLAGHAAPILSVLIIGTALNGMMTLPFALQLAHGWTRLAIGMNIVAIIVLLPALILAVASYGASGAAVIWLLLNVGYIIFGLTLMHRKIFRGELRYWLIFDFGLPFLTSMGVIICFWLLLPKDMGTFGQLLWILITGLVSCCIAAWTAPAIRLELLQRVQIWR